MDEINEEITNAGKFVLSTDFWMTISQALLKIIIIILLAMITIRVSKTIINTVFKKRSHGPIKISERRENTLKKLIQSIITYVVYFTGLIMILDNALGLKVGPLIAGAGVAGLAIGFGAQNLVKDVITGFFIIFEDQFSVGDYITTAGVEGTVEEIGLRTTKVLSWTGEQHVIPNGNITQVTNYSLHNGISVVDVNIPYESNIETVERLIEDILKTLPDKYEEFVSIPEILGVQTLDVSHFVIRVIGETLPSYQWSGARIIRKEIKEHLYKEGIEIPAPRLVMYRRDEQPSEIEKTRERE